MCVVLEQRSHHAAVQRDGLTANPSTLDPEWRRLAQRVPCPRKPAAPSRHQNRAFHVARSVTWGGGSAKSTDLAKLCRNARRSTATIGWFAAHPELLPGPAQLYLQWVDFLRATRVTSRKARQNRAMLSNDSTQIELKYTDMPCRWSSR